MCESVKVNYHLIFILLTSDSLALSAALASTYSIEHLSVTSAFRLQCTSWTQHYYGYIPSTGWDDHRRGTWSMCGGEKVLWTFHPLSVVYIKSERIRWSKGQVMTVPAGLFHLSPRGEWAAGDQSTSLQHTVVHFNLSIHALTAPPGCTSCGPQLQSNRRGIYLKRRRLSS